MRSIFQPYPTLPGLRAQAWNYQPEYRRPRHFHEEPEINLVTKGRGTIEVGERKIVMEAGSLVWLPPGLDHYLANASDDFELVTIGFKPSLIQNLAREHSINASFARGWQRLDAAEAARLRAIIGDIHAATDSQSIECRSMQVLRTLLELSSSAVPRVGHRAASLIVTKPTTSRDCLAHTLGINRGDVSRHFHRDHGVTLRQYRNVLRTLDFLRLSANGSNLARAAVEAGFGSYSQCHRVFRSLLGISPREFVAARRQLPTIDQFDPLA